MIKSVCAPLAVGIMLVPQVSLAVANETAPNERAQSVLRKADWQDKDLSSYLPALSSQPPWLDLDARTKLPKSDFPLGREVTGIGRLTLQPVLRTQMSSHDGESAGLRWRMSP